MTSYISELKIIFSNCLYGGSAFLDFESLFVEKMKEYFSENNIEFRGLNINRVTGDHTAFTMSAMGVNYSYKKNTKTDFIDTNELSVYLVNAIDEFNCMEIRVEHIRTRGVFDYLHPGLRGGL